MLINFSTALLMVQSCKFVPTLNPTTTLSLIHKYMSQYVQTSVVRLEVNVIHRFHNFVNVSSPIFFPFYHSLGRFRLYFVSCTLNLCGSHYNLVGWVTARYIWILFTTFFEWQMMMMLDIYWVFICDYSFWCVDRSNLTRFAVSPREIERQRER